MNVMETKNVARRWVEENARGMPGFRAAHLVGGITAMDDHVPFPRSKDVDLHLIFEDGSPIFGQRGPLPNILEVEAEGLALEMGIKPVSDLFYIRWRGEAVYVHLICSADARVTQHIVAGVNHSFAGAG